MRMRRLPFLIFGRNTTFYLHISGISGIRIHLLDQETQLNKMAFLVPQFVMSMRKIYRLPQSFQLYSKVGVVSE